MPDYGYLHAGRIVRQDTDTGNWMLEDIGLARSSLWGPVPTCVPGLAAGDKVVLAATGTSRDNLTIIARVGQPFPAIADIPGLVAALAGKADDADITTLQGRATALEGRATALESRATTVEGRATALEGRATTVEGRATTLEGRATALETRATAVEGRATALEAKVGYVVPIASVAARPSTGLYNGFPIFRTDKGFAEFYDGTVWRVRETVSVAALADITNPTTGQLALLTTDNIIYRYSGSAWVRTLNTDVTDDGHFRAYANTGSGQSIASGGSGAKMLVQNDANTTAGVTKSGNNTFTFVWAGRWHVETGVAWAAGPELAFRNLRLANSAQSQVFAEDGVRSVDSNHSISITRKFAVNDTVSSFLYHEHSTSVSTSPSGTERCHMSLTWLGP